MIYLDNMIEEGTPICWRFSDNEVCYYRTNNEWEGLFRVFHSGPEAGNYTQVIGTCDFGFYKQSYWTPARIAGRLKRMYGQDVKIVDNMFTGE